MQTSWRLVSLRAGPQTSPHFTILLVHWAPLSPQLLQAPGCRRVLVVSLRNGLLFGNGLTQTLQVIQQDREGFWERPGDGSQIRKGHEVLAEEQGCPWGGVEGLRKEVLRSMAGVNKGSQKTRLMHWRIWSKGSRSAPPPSPRLSLPT